MNDKLRIPQLRALVFAGIFLSFAISLLVLLSDHDKSHSLVRNSYDWSFRLVPSRVEELKDSPVVIVYLDLFSFEQENQNPSQPWDRALHAQLLDRLTAEGAKAVVFDIIFSDPGADPIADEKLARAIKENGNVILAAELEVFSQDTGAGQSVQMSQLVLPYESFLQAAAGWGIAQTKIDDDFAVRENFPGFLENEQPSLSWATARMLQFDSVEQDTDRSAMWVNYYGRPLSIPHVSYSQALDPDGVKEGFFKDKIVLIGALPFAGAINSIRDEFRSPVMSKNSAHPFMPGVEVHATQLLNLVRTDWVERFLFSVETGVLLASAILFGLLLQRFRPLPSAGVAMLAEVAVIATAVSVFRYFQIWFPWLIVSLVQIPVAFGWNVITRSIDWYVHRRKLEEARRVAQFKIAEQARLIDEAHDAIIVLDQTRRIRFWSSGAEKLYGWNAREVMENKKEDFGLSNSPEQLSKILGQLVREGSWVGELEQRKKDGKELIVQSSWTRIQNESEEGQSILIINTDITEKKKVEDQFLRAQRMEALGNLAGGIVHDLNNILSPVLLGIQRLKRKTSDEDTQSVLEMMESNTHRGSEMLKQILTFSRRYSAHKQIIDLRTVLADLVKMLQDTFPKSVRIDAVLPDDLWTVSVSPTQIHQVFLNLCINARDAMPHGGEILIAADNVNLTAEEAAHIPVGRPGKFVTVTVSDTGTGISSELMQRIFDPFFTTKAPGVGTGLGLPTCKSILINHGGFILVRSEFGEGTCFEVFLPKGNEI